MAERGGEDGGFMTYESYQAKVDAEAHALMEEIKLAAKEGGFIDAGTRTLHEDLVAVVEGRYVIKNKEDLQEVKPIEEDGGFMTYESYQAKVDAEAHALVEEMKLAAKGEGFIDAATRALHEDLVAAVEGRYVMKNNEDFQEVKPIGGTNQSSNKTN